MERPLGSYLKNIWKGLGWAFGRSSSMAPKVNIGEVINITFGATHEDFLISYPMKIHIIEVQDCFQEEELLRLICHSHAIPESQPCK